MTKVLNDGEEKHRAILKTILFFLPWQLILATVAPDVFVLMTAVSFLALMLGSAWYVISFQNVDEAQLNAGVATFITKKMFRAFMLSCDTLLVAALLFIFRTMLPEMMELVPAIRELPIIFRIIVVIFNVAWLLLVGVDIYYASVAYDAVDSMLADAMPTLIKGAKASDKYLRVLELLEQLCAFLQKKEGNS
ncbi:MAG: hypothetical protein PHZ00_07505 [Candidatus Peribacteraceae bacterium]|nr:hypothetical protein [Candidatus Peribacteraceae bacterium]